MGNVLEGAVAFVQEELIRLALIKLWIAVVRDPLKSAQRVYIIAPLHVVDHKEVQ